MTEESIVVVGGGIIGLTTAYELSKTYKVHVVEKRGAVCEGASFQNGGVINVESISPVNSYMSLWNTVKNSFSHQLFGKPSNTLLRPAALFEPNLLLWTKYFLLNTSKERIIYHAEGMRQMGAAITPLMEELFLTTGIKRLAHNYHRTPGLLLNRVTNPAQYVTKRKELFDRVFVKQFITGKELDLVKDSSGILGLDDADHNVGCVEPNNITVNTKKLGESLKNYLLEKGVQFTEGTEVRLVPANGRIQHVESDDGCIISADKYVVCAGYDSNRLLKNVGINIPLVPIKAYSLHISNLNAAKNWRFAVHIDSEVAALFTPYHERVDEHSLRITGIRDMDGNEPTLRKERVEDLKSVARKFAGTDWVDANVKIWCGIMPLSPDDFPVIGRTQRFSNLYLNVGHGFRGTAYSLPSARLLLQLMTGTNSEGQTCFDKKFAAPSRFGL